MKRIIFVCIVGVLSLFPVTLSAQDSESRYNKEFVFPLHMRNISLGASPVILRDFMSHTQDDQGLAVTLPQFHLMIDRCEFDFGNAGSVGWAVFISYGRYKFRYDGYGGNQINVRAGMLQAMVGPSYHYTIRTRFEVYLRPMIAIIMTGFRYTNADSDLVSDIVWSGVVGLRYFFSDRFGVYAEGGYTSGGVNAGFTYRW